MLHTCVRIFDVTSTVEFFLKTKQGLRTSVFGGAHARGKEQWFKKWRCKSTYKVYVVVQKI